MMNTFQNTDRLLDNSPDAVFLVGNDWSVEYANRRAVELTETPVVGTSLWTFLSKLPVSDAERECRRAVHDRVEVEFEVQTPAGQWSQVCARPYQNGLALYWRDITKFKLAEQALHEREAELRDFFENGDVALHWVGPDGTILWANNVELAMLGYTAEEYVGQNIKDFHVDPPVIEDILRRLMSNEGLQGYESRLRCKDGSIRHVAMNSSVYRKNGKFIHTRCFTR
jgi:PAS domain S-box